VAWTSYRCRHLPAMRRASNPGKPTSTVTTLRDGSGTTVRVYRHEGNGADAPYVRGRQKGARRYSVLRGRPPSAVTREFGGRRPWGAMTSSGGRELRMGKPPLPYFPQGRRSSGWHKTLAERCYAVAPGPANKAASGAYAIAILRSACADAAWNGSPRAARLAQCQFRSRGGLSPCRPKHRLRSV
jgi:hypothetical protein